MKDQKETDQDEEKFASGSPCDHGRYERLVQHTDTRFLSQIIRSARPLASS